MIDDTLRRTDVLLGHTADDERVTVHVGLTRTGRNAESVTHETLTDPLELTVSALVYAPRARDPHSAGQCVGEARRITRPAKGWTLAGIAELVDIWERWHLNGVRAGCAHQSVVYEDGPYGRRPSLDLSEPCPVTGYRYGSAWLTEPLPDDVVARVHALIAES